MPPQSDEPVFLEICPSTTREAKSKMSKEEGESTNSNNEKIRLFVRIQGLSPFQLHQRKGLRIKSYLEIVERYYSDLYSGKPPCTLIPHRVIVLNNGDKLMEFRRKESKSYSLTVSSCFTIHQG